MFSRIYTANQTISHFSATVPSPPRGALPTLNLHYICVRTWPSTFTHVHISIPLRLMDGWISRYGAFVATIIEGNKANNHLCKGLTIFMTCPTNRDTHVHTKPVILVTCWLPKDKERQDGDDLLAGGPCNTDDGIVAWSEVDHELPISAGMFQRHKRLPMFPKQQEKNQEPVYTAAQSSSGPMRARQCRQIGTRLDRPPLVAGQ